MAFLSQSQLDSFRDSLSQLDVSPLTWAMVVVGSLAGFVLWMPMATRISKRFRTPVNLARDVAEVLDCLPGGVMILNDRGCVVAANLALCRMLGITKNRLIGRDASSLGWVCSRDHVRGTDPWHRALETLVPPDDQWMRYQTSDGPVRTLSVHATLLVPRDRCQPAVVVNLQDVTDWERRTDNRDRMVAVLKQDRSVITKRNRQLQRLASTDPLTGCLNRRSFFAKFESTWTAHRAAGQVLSVMMIDIDHFKLLNDTYGHDFGDAVLRKVSATLREAFADPSVACRYGGEEFCVLMPHIDLPQAVEIAEAVREVIERLKFDADRKLTVTISTGVSDTKYGAGTPVELIGQADRCLYDAKARGRNQVTSFADLTSRP